MRKHPIGEVIQLGRISTFVRIAPPHITSGLPTLQQWRHVAGTGNSRPPEL